MKKFLSMIMALLIIMSTVIISSAATGDTVNVSAPNYSFTTLDGDVITNSSNSGKTKLFVFFRTTCYNSQQFITNLSRQEWISNPNLSIIAAEIDDADTSEIASFKETYANNDNNIEFCGNSNQTLWRFWDKVSQSSSVTLPVMFVVDSLGQIRYYETGCTQPSLQLLTELSKYTSGIKAPALSNISVKGTIDYTMAFKVLEIVNVYRAKEGLSALKMNAALLDASMQRAAECSVYYSHTRPNGSSCFTIIDEMSYVGENIATGQQSPEEVMNDWINSPGHKANIMNPDFNSIGVGVFYQDGYISWVQLFAGDVTTSSISKSGTLNKTFNIEIFDDHLSFESNQINLFAGDKETLSILNRNAGWQYVITKISPSSFTFKSNNTKVATVNNQGVVTAVGVGKTTVIATTTSGEKTEEFTINVLPKGETLYKVDGKWYYIKNGELDFTYTGLVKYGSKWYYVEDGVKDSSYTGLAKRNGKWYYVKKGVVDFSYTGLCKYDNSWYYINKGVVDFDYTGLCKRGTKWYYVDDGEVNFTYTGLAKRGKKMYYVKKGVVDFDYTGVVKYGKKRYYVEDGVVDKSQTGLVKSGKKYYYVEDGVVDTSYTGLAKLGKKMYYVSKGVVDFDYTGIVKHGKKRYYVEDGIVDKSHTGLVKSGKKMYYVKKGVVDFDYTGVVKYGKKRYYVEDGIVDKSQKGIVKSGKKLYYVKNGVVDTSYTGLKKYNKKTYYVKKGVVDKSYTGIVKINGKNYNIKKGVKV